MGARPHLLITWPPGYSPVSPPSPSPTHPCRYSIPAQPLCLQLSVKLCVALQHWEVPASQLPDVWWLWASLCCHLRQHPPTPLLELQLLLCPEVQGGGEILSKPRDSLTGDHAFCPKQALKGIVQRSNTEPVINCRTSCEVRASLRTTCRLPITPTSPRPFPKYSPPSKLPGPWPYCVSLGSPSVPLGFICVVAVGVTQCLDIPLSHGHALVIGSR